MSVRIMICDVMDGLSRLDDDSIDCVVTSPPYWGLRDYGVAGQIGMEPTMAEHLAVMGKVFEMVRRVLKPEGTLWLNYGDCYAGSWRGQGQRVETVSEISRRQVEAGQQPVSGAGSISRTPGLKPKDLCMLPNRIAIALQEAGWWVRSEIVWAKPNPMPESVTDRPSSSHEKIWLMTKSAQYFYDADAVRERVAPATVSRVAQDVEAQTGSVRANGGAKTNGNMKAVLRRRDVDDGARPPSSRPHSLSKFEKDKGGVYLDRNMRNVWTVATPP
jgi:DNA modification methylase